MADIVEIAWLAGILEGEGCFRLNWVTTKNGRSPHLSVSLSMTDLDVVERCMRVVGVGTGPYAREIARQKTQYTWHVRQGDDAEWLMEQVLPFMGARRAQKIRECLAEYQAQRPKTKRPIDLAPGMRPCGHGEDQQYWYRGKREGCKACRSLSHKRWVEAQRAKAG